jgi:hypothetical protein
MAIDPICGMTVDEVTARSAKRDGQGSYEILSGLFAEVIDEPFRESE